MGNQAHEVTAPNRFKVLGKLPINNKLAAACDAGLIELFDGNWLDKAICELLGE